MLNPILEQANNLRNNNNNWKIAIQQLKQQMSAYQNPQAALNQILMSNPNVANAMNFIKQNGNNPQVAFMNLAKQMGVDPQEVLRELQQ